MFLDPGYNYISQQPLNSSSSHSPGLITYSDRIRKYQNMERELTMLKSDWLKLHA